MYDCHKHQYDIIAGASNNGGTKLSAICSESHQRATVLEFEINSLCSSFTKWISSLHSYLESINKWLLKGVRLPLRHQYSRRRNPQFSPRRVLAPPVFITCRDWLELLNELPTKEVTNAIKDLVDVRHQERGRYEEFQGNDAVVDWSLKTLNYNNLQSSLLVLLGQLKSFAEVSVTKYEGLQKSIDEARAVYERHGLSPFD